MGQSPSKMNEKEAAASISRLSLDKSPYVFVDSESRMFILHRIVDLEHS